MTDPQSVLERFFDGLDVAIVILTRAAVGDEHFVLTYANELGVAYTSLPRERVIDRPALEIFPKLRELGFLDHFITALDSGRPIDAGELPYSDERVGEIIFKVRFVPLDMRQLAIVHTDITEEKRNRALLEHQQRYMMAMSTPVIELWHDILLLPLIGDLDAIRTQQMLERLLQAIVDHQARVAIFDITGVPTVDTMVAQSLMQSVQAARMLGAQVLLTGIAPETAMTLVKLGLDIGDLRTYRSLHRGIAAAFQLLGLQITSLAS